MEERKRPASHDHDDSAPPLKKQATTVNGNGKAHVDAEMPWKDDLERFQKDAIWRQMQEFKRERNTLETRINDLTKRATYHDDHLRVIDAWLSQLLDEIKILSDDVDMQDSYSAFPSALLTTDNSTFEKHLNSRSTEIFSTVSQLFARTAASSPQVSDLQGRIAQLLANEKGHITELEKYRLEKVQLVERLEHASFRYMVAEKKLDRSKSVTVARLERHAISGGRSESGSGFGGSAEVSGDAQGDASKAKIENGDDHLEAEEARKEAVAAFEKQKDQLEALEADNDKLTAQVTTLNNRLSRLSDDDYSRTDLFKHLKSQHEDVIKHINNLEATNVQLREEAEKLQKERTAYRIQIENESQSAIAEKETQLVQAENDLARIRTSRDELIADVTMRKAAQGQERLSMDQIRELASVREERVKALESEVERLCLRTDESACLASPRSNLEDLSIDELHNKYSNLERQYSMLSSELQSMANAYKKAQALASQKLESFSALEDKTVRLGAEKSKADQKYFAAMKAKEAREQEVRSLRASSSKSSEMVSTLKDAEATTRASIINLEKELAEYKTSHANMSTQYRATQQQLNEHRITAEGLKAQVEELKKNIIGKDSSASEASSAHRKAEVEMEKLKVRLEETQKSLESWKNKGLGNQSDEYEMLRVSSVILLQLYHLLTLDI
ncbi:E3 ubiquitin-protein ligase bre1 [Sticta canariensis]|nr:E3 ubiquitin-protein ligase bre1 [Sticta canariensis]